MKRTPWILAVALFVATGVARSDAPPPWFLEEIQKMTGGSGRWVADNTKYMSEQEPYDAYGMVWSASFDGMTMTGRLFGIREGKEGPDFWEFRQYWHPERNEVVLEQFGWGGTVGIGKVWHDGEVTRSDQRFYAPGKPERRTGHRSSFPTEETHSTESFDIEGDEWKPRRIYSWKRTPDRD